MFLKLMYITNDIEIAKIAQKYEVDRIWIDLEQMGKEERQKGLNTVKSNHTITDITKLRPVLDKSELLVRINPINSNSEEEINQVIAAGADIIMLPMWKTLEEVKQFLTYIDGRVKTILLLETREAVDCVDDVLEYGGFQEIHIGLNDLHLSYKMDFMFELLANGLVEKLCNKFKNYSIEYGFGGIAKIGDGLLPAEKIIMEHYRMGSTRAILSRTFCDNARIHDYAEIDRVFNLNMKKLKEYEMKVEEFSLNELEKNKNDVKKMVTEIVSEIKEKKNGNK